MYYIYILKNPVTGLPFYVGVGKRNRRSHLPREKSHCVEALKFRNGKVIKGMNRHKINTILKILDSGLEVDIEIGNEFESEVDAFNEEIKLIAHFGRCDLNTGILTNMTNGGEGRVNPSPEERHKASELRKGKPSHAKGKILGEYSEKRKQLQKEKMAITRSLQSDEEKQIRKTNRSNAQKGKTPWNKGKTKKTNESVAKYANAKVGKSRPDMVGKDPWSKGKTKETDSRLASISEKAKGRIPYNKGQTGPHKGLSYEEIYGVEKAFEIKEKRRLKKLEYWKNKRLKHGE